MRFDSVGLWWQDLPASKGGSGLARVMPPIPETGWRAPRDFPNLSAARIISFDTETYDPELLDHGPGWARGKGHIVGASLCTEDGHAWYFPMRHEVQPELNLDPANVLAYLRDTLGDPRQYKCGANLLYDVGWLAHEGVTVRGELLDVQFAEALLEETSRTNLDLLMVKYLGVGKETNALYQWCSDYYGGDAGPAQRKNIYRSPPSLVGPYAESDAYGPYHVLMAQIPELKAQGLFELFRMECETIPLLVAMRMKGVRVDIEKAERVRDELAAREVQELAKIKALVGFEVNVNAADSLARAFDTLSIPYGRTQKGAPSFTQTFLDEVEHPLADHIREARKCAKLRGTFVESYILNSHVNGRVHCQFHPLRGDEGGTRSGRFSSSTPNLQNIPSRDKELAPLVRGLFLPEPGCSWVRFDYSQIEYRALVHYATGPGAEEARGRYRENPKTDYHEYVIKMIADLTGFTLDRKPAKNINFGLVYGMQIPKLIRTLGLDRKRGMELFSAYHQGVPFVQSTMDATAAEARELGYITTWLGRRSRFELWEPAVRQRGEDRRPGLPYEAALREYGSVQRAYLHKALNRRLQGTAADLMKAAMVLAWRWGLFGTVGIPLVTVHDELGFSDDGDPVRAEGWRALEHVLETALPFNIPIKVECESGPDWGHVK